MRNASLYMSLAAAAIATSWCLQSCFGQATAASQADLSASSAPAAYSRKFRRSDRAFLITTEAEVNRPENGMVMVCPAHNHGTPDEAVEKLKGILRTVPGDQLTSIWVCRADEAKTLRKFAPFVDQVVLNPFTNIETAQFDKSSPIWPGCDQPILNFIRLLRTGAGETRLVACICTKGEATLFKKRTPSSEEIEWMMGAVIGANFQGIAWRYRGELQDEFQGSLQRRLGELAQYVKPLGAAAPCDWATGDGTAPVAAIQGENLLFVIILNPHYMKPSADGVVPLPLEPERESGTVRLKLPVGVTVASGKSISGERLAIRDNSFKFSFTQGCAIYILQTAGTAATAPATRGAK